MYVACAERCAPPRSSHCSMRAERRSKSPYRPPLYHFHAIRKLKRRCSGSKGALMSRFSDAIKSGRFLVTAELNPPKGTDLDDMLRKAERLKGWVDAFNLTDSASAIMTMAPMAAAYRLVEHDAEPILQVTGRDRNRIAL